MGHSLFQRTILNWSIIIATKKIAISITNVNPQNSIVEKLVCR